MNAADIIAQLPYQRPFLFVDALTHVSEDAVEGSYRFRMDEYFYQGHFTNQPITPGVILTEVMAQIGVVCLGIYLMAKAENSLADTQIALTSHQVDFYKTVLPGDKVVVRSEKIYFRFQKLKCKVFLYNEQNELVCRGTIAGMLKSEKT